MEDAFVGGCPTGDSCGLLAYINVCSPLCTSNTNYQQGTATGLQCSGNSANPSQCVMQNYSAVCGPSFIRNTLSLGAASTLHSSSSYPIQIPYGSNFTFQIQTNGSSQLTISSISVSLIQRNVPSSSPIPICISTAAASSKGSKYKSGIPICGTPHTCSSSRNSYWPSNTVISINCALPNSGVGGYWSIQLSYCDPSAEQNVAFGCYGSSFFSVDTLSYSPPPIFFVSGTIGSALPNSPIGTEYDSVIVPDPERIRFSVGNWPVSWVPVVNTLVSFTYGGSGSLVLDFPCTSVAVTAPLNLPPSSLTTTVNITCSTTPYISPKNFHLALSWLSGLTSTDTTYIVSTDIYTTASTVVIPTISSVTVSTGCTGSTVFSSAPGCDTRGSTAANPLLVTIIGSGFSASGSIKVFISLSFCSLTAITPTNDTVICEFPAGVGAALPITVNVGGITSSPLNVISYAAPVIFSIASSLACQQAVDGISLIDCPRETQTLTIFGQNFGPSGASVFMGIQICGDVQHDPVTPHLLLTCTLAPGRNLNNPVLVTQKNGLISSNPVTFSFVSCTPGYYDPVSPPPNAQCLPCWPGTYSSSVGSIGTCIDCPAGLYSSNPAAPICTACSIGSYQNRVGMSNCLACDFGTYADGTGFSTCSECVNGYSLSTSASNCIHCPSDADCSGSTIQPATDGYYVGFQGSDETADSQPEAFTCPRCVQCPSQSSSNSSSIASSSSSSNSSIAALQLRNCCGLNRQVDTADDPNVLCGQCAEGYVEWANDCVQCEYRPDLLFSLVVLSFVLLFLVYHSSQSTRGTARIWWYFTQTSIFILGTQVSGLDWLNIFNFDPSSGTGNSCVAPLTAYQHVAWRALLPIFFAFELALVALLHFIAFTASARVRERTKISREELTRASVSRFSIGSGTSAAGDNLVRSSSLVSSAQPSSVFASSTKGFPVNRYIRCLTSLLLHTYYSVATSTLRYLECVEINGTSVVQTLPSINCRSNEYQQWLPAFLTLLILDVCVFPIAILLFLYFRRREINKGDPAFVSRWGILFYSYREKAWFLQPFVLLRQVLLVALDVVIVDNTNKYLAFSYLLLFILVIHLYLKPYRGDRENHLETASFCLLLLLAMTLNATSANAYTSPPLAVRVWIFALVLPFGILLTLLMLYRQQEMFKQYWVRYRERKSMGSSGKGDHDRTSIKGLETVAALAPIAPANSANTALDTSSERPAAFDGGTSFAREDVLLNEDSVLSRAPSVNRGNLLSPYSVGVRTSQSVRATLELPPSRSPNQSITTL